MSEPLTWHDLDQLADFSAGQLSGPEADRVARLIASDSRWAATYRALNNAEPAVRAALQTAAAARPVEPMPDSPRRLTRTITLRPSRRRPVVAALAVLVLFTGIGGAALIRDLVTSTQQRSSTTADADNGAAGPQPPSQPERPTGPAAYPTPLPALGGTDGSGYGGYQPPIYRSDGDYRHDDLAALYRAWPGQRASLDEPQVEAAGLPDLTRPEGFAACLAAVTAAHPGDVTRALFARYQSGPALFLALRRGQIGMVVVVGPACGHPGTDEVDFIEIS